jgi:D-amino-acid dehydrogenase
MTQHVVIIGAGIVGTASAVALLRDGQPVTIVEPGEPAASRQRATATARC